MMKMALSSSLVRTSGSQPGDWGSNPHSATNLTKGVLMKRLFIVFLIFSFLSSLILVSGCAKKETPQPPEEKEQIEEKTTEDTTEEKEEVKEEEKEVKEVEEKEQTEEKKKEIY